MQPAATNVCLSSQATRRPKQSRQPKTSWTEAPERKKGKLASRRVCQCSLQRPRPASASQPGRLPVQSHQPGGVIGRLPNTTRQPPNPLQDQLCQNQPKTKSQNTTEPKTTEASHGTQGKSNTKSPNLTRQTPTDLKSPKVSKKSPSPRLIGKKSVVPPDLPRDISRQCAH